MRKPFTVVDAGGLHGLQKTERLFVETDKNDNTIHSFLNGFIITH